VDRRTLDTYERVGATYSSRSNWFDRAAALVEGIDGPRADLGCGPGEYASVLGRPLLALDGAMAMLRRVQSDAWRVQADLEALPLRTGSLQAAWASKTYQHLVATRLPLALADLHRSLAVDAAVELTVFGGEGVTRLDDHRLFSHWRPEQLVDLLIGAGFDDVEIATTPSRDEWPHLQVRARRARTLADTVGPDMRVLVCGLNPSVYAADAGHGFARRANRFWPAAVAAGLTGHPQDPRRALLEDGMGMTDLVKRPSSGADVLTAEEYASGLARVERLAAWLRPAVVCFIGLAGWRSAVDRRASAGLQERTLGGRPVYLCPSTSGRNASSQLPQLVAHLEAVAALAAG
jgi:TDG/mug DNA glycosylase family protein